MTIDHDLAELVQQHLAHVGVHASVTIDGRSIRLEGLVDSERLRDSADDLVGELAPAWTVDNQLEVIESLPVPDRHDADTETDRLVDALHVVDAEALEDARDVDAFLPDDEERAADAGTARPYFPPTDPVVRVGAEGTEILGGFAATSVDEVAEDTRAIERPGAGVRGDDEIADDVRRELAEDALTAELPVDVEVVEGVVVLRGTVSSLDDVEAAEDVAGRVPGVAEVDEDLEIAP